MAVYVASTQTLREWTARLDTMANAVKSQAMDQRALSAAGTLNMDVVRRFFDYLGSAIDTIDKAGAVAGLREHITAEKQGVMPDPVVSLTDLRTLMLNTRTWIRNNGPVGLVGGTPYRLAYNFPATNTGVAIPLAFAAVDTAPYRVVLDALIAGIG